MSQNKRSILLIDDEQAIITTVSQILDDEGYLVHSANEWEQARSILFSNKIDLLILDIWLPNKGGLEILQEMKELFPEIEIIMISGHADINTAVTAIKKGAFDFVEKPISLEKLLKVCDNAIKVKSLKEENESLKATNHKPMVDMIGRSPIIKEIQSQIEKAATSQARVLITGNNGTGKELVARMIHQKSNRNSKTFVELNCAAIPETLIESELFGYEKGAFTGADSPKKGKFEIAHHGTIFLDEIGDMSMPTQAKLLRVLQESTFERLGSTKTIKVDVRVIAATNKNLQDLIEENKFREDLYYRLNVIPIHLPDLIERREDIPLLVEFYFDYFAKEHRQTRKKIDESAVKKFQQLPWPGNIRELKNVVERLSIMISEPVITDKHLNDFVQEKPVQEDLNSQIPSSLSLKEAKDQFEKLYINAKLKENNHNVTKTAKDLEIERSHLHKKIKNYEI